MFTATQTPNMAGQAGVPCEYLCFGLGAEEYGIDIHKVQELRKYEIATTIANSPDYVKGVINLRGTIIPIIDMRVKFKLGIPSYNEFTVVIILHLADRMTGIVVDSVADVITLANDEIRDLPQCQPKEASSYLLGIGTVGERMLILIDMDQLLATEQVLVTSTLLN